MVGKFGHLDSGAVIVGRKGDKNNSNIDKIDVELTEGDKAFIRDCVNKGMTEGVTYSALTDHRLSLNRPRVLKMKVDEEYKLSKASSKLKVTCSISGLEADSLMKIRIASKKDCSPVVSLVIPVHHSVKNDFDVSLEFSSVKDLGNSSLNFIGSFPIIQHLSFIGNKDG